MLQESEPVACCYTSCRWCSTVAEWAIVVGCKRDKAVAASLQVRPGASLLAEVTSSGSLCFKLTDTANITIETNGPINFVQRSQQSAPVTHNDLCLLDVTPLNQIDDVSAGVQTGCQQHSRQRDYFCALCPDTASRAEASE